MTRTSRARTLIAVAALTALGACGDGDTPQEPVSPDDMSPVTEGELPTTDTATPQSTPEDSASAEAGGVPAEYDAVLAAVDRAVADHGPAFEVDADDGSWEVHVAVGGDEVEVRVSADGSEILATDREGALDSTDRAGLDAAGDFTLAQALRTAIAEYGGTTAVDEVTISDDDGDPFAWEVAFADDVEVYLDIATGALLRVETD